MTRCLPSNRFIKPWFVSRSRRITHLSEDFTFKTHYARVLWSTGALPDLLTRHLLFEGTYQEDVIQALLHLCHPGDTVFDVGGHHGYMAIVAGKSVEPKGRVVSFEPNPYSRKWLEYNIKLNASANIEVVASAVSSSKGHVVLHIQKGTCSWNTSIFSGSFSDKYDTEDIEVETITIDDYVQETGLVPSLIKIDIEGAELLALQGAMMTIATYRPVLILELNPIAADAAEVSLEDIVAVLHENGYALTVLRKNRLNRYTYRQTEVFSILKHCHDDLRNVICIPIVAQL